MENIKCGSCGKDFISESKTRKFCSKQCFDVFQRRKRPTLTCKACGKVFQVSPVYVKRGQYKFCSDQCRLTFSVKENHPFWRGGPLRHVCTICGKEYFRKKQKKQSVACSRKCQSEWQKTNRRGANNHQWRGGKTKDWIAVRVCLKYEQWREAIFKRDNYTCTNCHKEASGRLNAHHIKSFKSILNDIREKYPNTPLIDAAQTYDPLWDLSNGVTLCEECHLNTRKK